ncbi:MAG TPA: tetratricopeptide repeat protein [Verrucomicrobiae bacterium]|nr:tetratricopeptide repeat protein [Verrucomicrobiae bacterium]
MKTHLQTGWLARLGWLLCGAALSATLVSTLYAASPAEARAYEAALRRLQTGAYDLAERELVEFQKDYPQSEKTPEIILLQAECRYRQGQFDSGLKLLQEKIAGAGILTDQYRYWIGESLFKLEKYNEAATEFARLLQEFPASGRRLEASVGEAFTHFRLGDHQRAFGLLDRPEGAFRQAAKNRPADELAVQGELLFTEVCLVLKEFKKGEEALRRLAERNLPAELSWRRQYLVARLQFEDQRADAALQTLTNLIAELSPVTNALSLALQADAAAFRGEIFEKKGDPEAAIQTYERNLATTVPADRRQHAVQRIVALALAQNKIGEASRRLESFVFQNPKDGMLDLLRLTLGELRLKEYFNLPENARKTNTNLLAQARPQFEQVIANTNILLAGKASLNRGWCFWEEGQNTASTNRIAEGLAAFRGAAEILPRSEDQAVARFKWADCQFVLTDYAGAVTNYWQVVTNYADLSGVKESLADFALFQVIRASIDLGDLAGASRAVERILADYPDGFFGGRGVLLYGQALNRQDATARELILNARRLFDDFCRRFPASPLVPEIELAVARTYEHEGDWKEAIHHYDRWVTNHAGHASLPRAQFDRAWSYYREGNETQAFNLFTNYVAQFETSSMAPLAQYWIGEYYLRQEKYDLAELDFQKIFKNTNWPPTELTFRARMMAGRAAYFRQGYPAAIGYFTNLINDPSPLMPAALLPEAYFAYADTFIGYAEAVVGATNALDNYREAIVVLKAITAKYPTNRLALLAWGRMGDCYLQWATVEPKAYEDAVAAYSNVIRSDLADIAARSQAEVGIGHVEAGLARALEKQAGQASPSDRERLLVERTRLLNEALGRYLNVALAKNLRASEQANPSWVKEATLYAARLAKDQQRWDVAANLYRGLIDAVPALRRMWEARLEELEQARSAQASTAK